MLRLSWRPACDCSRCRFAWGGWEDVCLLPPESLAGPTVSAASAAQVFIACRPGCLPGAVQERVRAVLAESLLSSTALCVVLDDPSSPF